MFQNIVSSPLRVGIMQSPQIEFSLNGTFVVNGKIVCGFHSVRVFQRLIYWNGQTYPELYFKNSDNEQNTFCLHDVTIGKQFHWQQQENQTFHGDLHIIVSDNLLVAINLIGVEEYLTSVISSEMGATASLEFLKAHAVISRSWVYSQILRRSQFQFTQRKPCIDEEGLTWQDQSDHSLFDVCADDHCQRYQGISRSHNLNVNQAVMSTRGQVLTFEHQICDARFSKCCGGITERFSTCWDAADYSYLSPVLDSPEQCLPLPDLSVEENAEKWIMSAKPSFCNTTDEHLLHQFLNTYDQATSNFYRWKIELSQRKIQSLLNLRLQKDIGDVLRFFPLKRGASGRIYKLRIEGTLGSVTVGKELTIRHLLSDTHLYSSAFIVRPNNVDPYTHVPNSFTLFGAGWGHGVGLCQIGAAVMADKGYTYTQILKHYYPNSEIILFSDI